MKVFAAVFSAKLTNNKLIYVVRFEVGCHGAVYTDYCLFA
jgi:hypothetical protein